MLARDHAHLMYSKTSSKLLVYILLMLSCIIGIVCNVNVAVRHADVQHFIVFVHRHGYLPTCALSRCDFALCGAVQIFSNPICTFKDCLAYSEASLFTRSTTRCARLYSQSALDQRRVAGLVSASLQYLQCLSRDTMSDNTLSHSTAAQFQNSDHETPARANGSRPPDDRPDVDDFGLLKRPVSCQQSHTDSDTESETFHDAQDSGEHLPSTAKSPKDVKAEGGKEITANGKDTENAAADTVADQIEETSETKNLQEEKRRSLETTGDAITPSEDGDHEPPPPYNVSNDKQAETSIPVTARSSTPPISPSQSKANMDSPIMKRSHKSNMPSISDWSHMTLANRQKQVEEEEEVQWQAMTAVDEFDVYDDYGRLVAKGLKSVDEDEDNAYANIGGAGKGYTRILLDDDVESQNSFDDDTNYLFKGNPAKPDVEAEEEEEEDPRDMMQQLETTKDLLTEGQRIAYVGVVRLIIYKMLKALEEMEKTRATKKEIIKSLENMEIWAQQMMVRLYRHMDIDTAEQVMIEQLAEHGVQPGDLVPTLMINAKVKNPMADGKSSPTPLEEQDDTSSEKGDETKTDNDDKVDREEVPEVHGPEDMPKGNQIDLDIRWTVLCDLFLVLLADSNYDSRSRRLLERTASTMEINWVQICRFEKRVIDQLEMQEGSKENWDESDHMESRRKQALKRKYVYMGLATVGGGLVIGLSAGLLAPVIGAGLAAGFTTIGVTGTAGFLGGVGGAALITSAATAAGGTIAVRASHRRTGHVRTFEYRPLHNNKRLNLILTVSGWMTGKVDDVRLPFSTVDPIMGDIYSLYWEPEMLRSMGDTINILATEALTQSIQQVLGSTILVALMASLQLPIVLTKLSYLIDNPWSVSLDRANAAGLILADSLIARHLGSRPVTLAGFSLGARVIFSCLKELSNRGAYGIVQNVYLFGSPIVAKKDDYSRVRSVVAGRFVNAYASNDWILGYLFRATSGGIMKVAGLAPVEDVPGLENVDVTELVNGHMAYRAAMPKLLRKLNWEVESDEFTEIEDPDPENHAQRQRELIAEIDEARKKAEQKPEKKIFGLFKRGKLAEKKTWETYEAKNPSHKKSDSQNEIETENNMWGEGKVMFDIDAIRKELAGEQIEVRELDSTQPPIQISTIKDGEKVTEYLRLPPGISPEEVKKMKLPPRPDEIDDGPLPFRTRNGTPRTSSSTPGSLTPRINKPASLQPSPLPEYDANDEFSAQPKELKSTLPPLQLSPGIDTKLSPNVRPELKSHTTTPLPDKGGWGENELSRSQSHGQSQGQGQSQPQTASVGLGLGSPGLVSPVDAMNLEHNAWGDDEYNDGEIKMTFA